MKLWRAAIVLLVLATRVYAQDSATIALSSLRVNVYGALLFNRSFSNIPARKEFPDENSVITRQTSPVYPAFYPGFLLGTEALVLPREKFKLMLGLGISYSKAAHHYTYFTEDPSVMSGFAKIRRTTELDISQALWMLHFNAGVRKQVMKNFFAKASLVLDKPLRMLQEQTGYTQTDFLNAAGDPVQSKVTREDLPPAKVIANANLSLRIEAEYQLQIMGSLARAFLFRNFGLIATQPWWGLGISVTVQE